MAQKRTTKASASKGSPRTLTPEVLPREKNINNIPVEAAEDSSEVEEEIEANEGPSLEEAQAALPVVQDSTGEIDQLPVSSRSERDPFKIYMKEVQRYPLLDPDEEMRLAQELKTTGSIEAAKKLVQANLRLVVKIAYEYRRFYSNMMDLVQEGNIGLMKAVSKFEPDRGVKLGYYAAWWIRSYILKAILDNFRLVKVGTTQAQKKLFYHLMREKERLEAQGILPQPKLLADRLQVREKDVIEMDQRLSGRGAEVSLDAPTHAEGDSSRFSDLLIDEQEGADEKLAREEWLELLQERLPAFVETLNDREKRILRERLLSEEPKTLQEVADKYGLTRERVRQIEAKVLSKLREFLGSRLDR